MNFSPDGFLSPAMDAWRDQTRKTASEWFTLVESINRSAIALLPSLNPQQTSSRELMAAALFARALQSFAATIILAERGMLADAGTLARSIVETTVYLGGLNVPENFPKRMAAANNHHFFKFSNAIAEHLEEVGGFGEAADAAELRQLLQDAKDKGHQSKEINLRQLAKEAGMDPLYEVVFRQLSGDAAHVSVASGERHIVRGDGGRVEKLIFQPQRDGVERTLSAAIAGFLGAMIAISEVFSRPDITDIANTYNAAHHALGDHIRNRVNF